MKTRIVPIGNSQGIRIPKPIIDQAALSGELEISVRGHSLVIRPVRGPRVGWAEAFKAMVMHGDDTLLDLGSLPPIRWDDGEWEWS